MGGSGPSGLWTALFIYSKYFELMDTVFLVLRKKPVGFLHWYHHCSVLLSCWHGFFFEVPPGLYFVAMNYSVHSIMYFYYFLAAVCRHPPKWAFLVTSLQLAQMAGGIAVTLFSVNRLRFGPRHCDGYMPSYILSLAIYVSYFYLFAEFMWKSYRRMA